MSIQFTQARNITTSNIYDQDGNNITEASIMQERLVNMQALHESRVQDFMSALEDRCREDDIPYSIQHHPQVGNIYMLGGESYVLRVTTEDITMQRVQVG